MLYKIVSPDGDVITNHHSKELIEIELKSGFVYDEYDGIGPLYIKIPDGSRIEGSEATHE